MSLDDYDPSERYAAILESCEQHGHTFRTEYDTGALIPVCTDCGTDMEAVRDAIENGDNCPLGHDTHCPFCPGCCPCLGYCAERAAVIDDEGDELLSDARRDGI